VSGKTAGKPEEEEETVANGEREQDQVGKLEDKSGKSCGVPDAEDASLLSQDVIDAFFADTPAQLIKLRTLLADGDLEGARRVAHYLKGSAMCLGLQRMRELCQGIEMLTVLNGAPDISDIVPLLEAEFTRLRNELTAGEQKAAKGKSADSAARAAVAGSEAGGQ
jgi:HPt (histidine-containing phosphotransfer) domain-containing protein